MMHLAIGTPMYGGQCYGVFATSCLQLQAELLLKRNGRLTTIFPGNESLITRGRDAIAHLFLTQTDASHLLMADGDLAFRPNDVLRMIDANKGVICGPVAMKGLDWERVQLAALEGEPESALPRHASVYSLKPLPDKPLENHDEPAEIEHAGGFILIRRDVLESMAREAPSYRGGSGVGGVKVKQLFDTEIVDGELLSEDYLFCRRYRASGGTVWLAPWCQIGHMGTYRFGG